MDSDAAEASVEFAPERAEAWVLFPRGVDVVEPAFEPLPDAFSLDVLLDVPAFEADD